MAFAHISDTACCRCPAFSERDDAVKLMLEMVTPASRQGKKLEDLKPGQKIRVTTKKGDKEIAIKVEALDKNERFEKRTDRDRN
jgi:hypothetical protein